MTDLRRLQYFVAVAQERNFTRAAERLHIAQPALSRQVRLLEQELGVELLHRTTHEFELTEAGEFLLERGPALLSAADELWRSVRTYGTGERGQVVVVVRSQCKLRDRAAPAPRTDGEPSNDLDDHDGQVGRRNRRGPAQWLR